MAGEKQWRLTYQGGSYRESELTLDQAERIEELLGLSWLQINPLRSAKQARGILAVMHAEASGVPVVEVLAELGQMKANEFITDVFHLDPTDIAGSFVDGTPKVGTGDPTEAAAERSTSTS